jgi:hypothetical protein
MNTAVAIPIDAARSVAHSLRSVLVGLVLVMLVGASFVIGRTTSNASHGAARSPQAQLNAPAASATIPGPSNGGVCRVGKPC